MSKAQEDSFDEYLDENCTGWDLGVLHYEPSIILQRVDPVAYRCTFLEWLDANEEDEQ